MLLALLEQGLVFHGHIEGKVDPTLLERTEAMSRRLFGELLAQLVANTGLEFS